MDELLDADATAIAAAVRAREVSATEVAEAQMARIEARDEPIGAVWLVTAERARREAAGVDRALADGLDPGPLAGVPVGWKDLADTAGIRTTYGSAAFADHVPARDADAVARLAGAGAVTVAKLSLHELAWGTTNENPHFGDCRNPHDLGRVPGGSSGGSAAALAAGTVALAPGTDTGGSIRIPAACCGVVGLKPTFGRVSLAGIHPLAHTLDHCGPLARSVRDCALALEVLAGPSPRDPRTPPVPAERYRDALEAGVTGLVVAVAERYFFEHTQPDVAAPARAGVDALREAGARVVEIDLGWPAPGLASADLFLAEAAAALAEVYPSRRDQLGEDLIEDLDRVDRLDAIALANTSRRRLEYAAELSELVADAGVDVIAMPTLAFSPPPLRTRRVPFAGRDSVDVGWAMCGLTEIFDVLGWPAISVPCGRDGLGLPAGLQLAAAPWRESLCLAGAAAVESALSQSSPSAR